MKTSTSETFTITVHSEFDPRLELLPSARTGVSFHMTAAMPLTGDLEGWGGGGKGADKGAGERPELDPDPDDEKNGLDDIFELYPALDPPAWLTELEDNLEKWARRDHKYEDSSGRLAVLGAEKVKCSVPAPFSRLGNERVSAASDHLPSFQGSPCLDVGGGSAYRMMMPDPVLAILARLKSRDTFMEGSNRDCAALLEHAESLHDLLATSKNLTRKAAT